ncbi:hypothetical protein QBC38DRAFT_531765 [Podospora fimiseda]|uniref:Uncharacterized protein n=1 Tax=Podospora fimiseda TaxID=252190 RepID=A0AAN7BK15_9PEZI|nr:hypothetical protein QBC38DRAFT_531765 [Podospora fimiseda]
MSNQKETYFLCPTWDYHSQEGPIQLGNIIISPNNPTIVLNSPNCPRPTSDTLFPPTTKVGETWSPSKFHSGRYGIWTQFLSLTLGVGADISVEHSKTIQNTFHFRSMETIQFIPTTEYLEQALAASPTALEYLRRSRFKKHLYVVTSVKIARGASAKSLHSSSGGLETKIGIDDSSDFVFAFGLRKVVVEKAGKPGQTLRQSEYTKGAMYDDQGQVSKGGNGVQFCINEEAREEVLSGAEFGGEGGKAVVVEGDEETVCVRF